MKNENICLLMAIIWLIICIVELILKCKIEYLATLILSQIFAIARAIIIEVKRK